jgi:xylulokinase
VRAQFGTDVFNKDVMRTVLACDLGGTSFRAALVNALGQTIAEHTVPGPASNDDRGWSEIDPDAWWQILIEAASALADAAPRPFAETEAIAICGVTRTQILLDRDGKVLRPAITWRDARAEPADLLARLPQAHPEYHNVNVFHPVARLNWLRENEEDVFRRLATVLDPKDFLNFRLTGRRVSDPVSLARLAAAAANGPDGRSLLDAVGTPASVIPPLIAPTGLVGRVVAQLPQPLDRLAGKPVFCCSNDTWAAVLGLGALRPGCAYNISGTTEVFGAIGERPMSAEGLMSVDWQGMHQIGGPGQNGADTVAWLLALLGGDPQGTPVGTAINTLLRGSRDPQPVLFLPYLQGERTPFWDADLRGAFIGLNRNHRGVDLAWAVLEGIAFLNRIVLERAETALGQAVTEIRFGGGASSNPLWRQIKADVCERPVLVGESSQPGALGAAAVAWTGLKQFASLGAAQQALAHVAYRHEPDPARAAFYRPLFDLFRQSHDALAPTSRALAALARMAPAVRGQDAKDRAP